jgi:lipopolysaccharide heptosyltransferase II
VDEVIEIRAGENPWRLARRVRQTFDAAILFPNSLRSALEARALGVPRIAGYPGHQRSRLLHQSPRFSPESCGHQANRFLRLVAHCGAPQPEEGASFARRPRKRDAGSKLRLGVCPGAEYGPAKRWPAERFAATMASVAKEHSVEWVIFGVAGDAPAAAAIADACSFPVRNLAGQTTLDGLMDELSECDALLTNDTGTMHLAAMLGVPVVAIFGSTEPSLTGPLGVGHTVLQHRVPCEPCFQRECHLDFACMKGVHASEVAQALLTTLNNERYD